MNTALIQSDPDEKQRPNKGSNNTHTTTSNYITSLTKLKNTINNDTIPLITTTNSAPNDPTSITATATIATAAVVAQQQRGNGIYGHRLSGSLSKVASISRDYLYPVGSHGSLSTSYDAFFTDDGYNETEQGGIMAVPYTNGPVEFEDSRFYEGRYEDGGHDEYDYDASSSDNHGHGQHHQQQQPQQQQQHTPQRLRFSEEPMATEPTILAGSYRRHRQQSNRTQPVEQLDDQGAAAPLTASALLSPLRYRDVESTFSIRNEGDKDEYRYHLPSQSQLFQSEFTTGMSGAGYLEESVMEDNNHDDKDGMMRDEAEKKRKGSWRQQPDKEQEMSQDEQLQLQESGEEDYGDDDEEGGDESDDEEEDNNGRAESEDGEDDDEDDQGGPGGGAKGRKKSGRSVTSQKTIPKAMASFPSIQQEHNNQQHGQHSQSDLMQHCNHHHAPHRHQLMPHQSHYQTQQQLHQLQQQHHQQQHQHSTSSLSPSSSTLSTSTSTPTSSYHSGNFISEQQFLLLADDYLLSLSPKKREKALLSNSMYQKILMVLIQPKNTQVSTAQFRFWAKKMFTLSTTPTHHVVCHGGKPVATKECLYDVLVYCHRKSSHGGRDKTSAEVRQHYSWVPKELIARFVKHCPLCLSRRSTQQRQNGGPVAGGTNDPVGSLSLDIDGTSPSLLESHHGPPFKSNPPIHGSDTVHMSNGDDEGEEDKENSGEDNGDINVDQGGLPDMHSRVGKGHREVHSALSTRQQPTFSPQPHSEAYGHQLQQHHHHTSFSSMQRTGFDALQIPNSPIGNTHEGSQPWAWRKTSLGDVDSKDDGSIDRRQQQQHVGDPSSMMTTLHDSPALQDFSQADNDDDEGMQVERDLGHDHEDENDDVHSETTGHQAEIQNSMDPTHSTTTAVAVAHSELYYSKRDNQGTAFSFDNDEDSSGGNSSSEMDGIKQDPGQSDGNQYRDSAFLHHQHYHQQQRFFPQNHRHQHQHSVELSRYHPYQHQHRHTYDTIPNRETTQPSQPVTTVHPNGHILHDRHPIHNRARIMALANSAAVATAATATGGDPVGAPAIPPIHAIHQAALTLSQQYHHHYHHHQQQQHQCHHQLASTSHSPYLQHHYQHQHHGHHSLQQHTQQLSYRQAMAQTTPSGVVSGFPSAFMYTFTNPDDDGEDGAYDQEGSEEDLEDDGGDEDGPITDDGDEAEVDEGGAEHGGGEVKLLLLSESGLAATVGQDSQMAD